jgi:FtsP/CotA-like multicopper oxidase with cupredoxin domain/plastocyanin
VSAGGWRRIAVVTGLIAATAGSGTLTTSYADPTPTPTPSPSATGTPSPTPSPTSSPAPTAATIIIGHGARYSGYQTPSITLAQGGSLSVVNEDSMEHTVTSKELGADQRPLFDVFAEPGSTMSIPSVSKLAAGVYHFKCTFHPQTMKGTLTIVGGNGGGVHPVAPKFDQPLVKPKVLTGSHIRIPIKKADVRVLPHGGLTRMWTYNGTYPGPTIVRPVGEDTKVTFVDHLPKTDGSFTVHYHGDHHKSADDGRPTTQLIHHGDSRTYDFPLTDNGRPEMAAFNFYHDHRMGLTTRNNWMGLQGMFITKDPSSKLRLPTGKYDVPLLVSERSFTKDNQLVDNFPAHPKMMIKGPKAPPGDGTVGSQILANGRFAPYLKVSTHRYRLRLLNASPFTSYNFQLSDGKPFVQIGTGDGLLPAPVIRQSILLGPAQRADVIVDFHRELHRKVILESVPRTDAPTGGVGTPSAAIMQFRVTSQASTDSTRIPSAKQMPSPPPINAPKKVSASWTLNLTGDEMTGSVWTINGKPFDPDRSDLKVPLGSTQTWRLHNASPITHYFHLHEEAWHTVSRNGKKPPAWEAGLEDTWKLDPGETVKVAAHFTDFTGRFMLHCHMLDHEDHGLMAQFEVVRSSHKAATGPAAQAAKAERVLRKNAPSPTQLWGLTLPALHVSAADVQGWGMSPAELKAMMCGPKKKAHNNLRPT